MGILLGYGRHNALAFANYSRVQQLERLYIPEESRALDDVFELGCMGIQNGTNQEENQQVLQTWKDGKINLLKALKSGKSCLEIFIDRFTF